MAGLNFWSTSGEITLVANTALTVWQIKMTGNAGVQRAYVKKIRLWGKQPAGGTDTPVKVRLTRNTTAYGTLSAALAGKWNPSNAEAIQSVVGKNATVEPTTPTDTGWLFEYNPQLGVIEDFPLDKWIDVPGNQSLQVEMTSPGTPVVGCTIDCEE